jgi:nucleotide-binding universal stress UspA family protein
VYNKVLVANDGSKGGYAALHAGIDLAKKYSSELHMITIEEIPVWGMTGDVVPIILIDEHRKYLEEVQAHSMTLASKEGVMMVTHLPLGDPVMEISDFAATFDLLVMGFTPHSLLYKWFIRSVSNELVSDVPCSVLVIKEKPEPNDVNT